jgi:hypothetical protein
VGATSEAIPLLSGIVALTDQEAGHTRGSREGQSPRRSASLPGMVIGTLVLHLQVPGSESLKDKRQVVRSLVARVRRTFNVAIAEVGDQDLWQAVELGVACVSNDARHADEVCQKVLNFVGEDAEALLVDSRFEIVRL